MNQITPANVHAATAQVLTAQIERTRSTLIAHVQRNATTKAIRSLDLIQRYDGQRRALHNINVCAWNAYCCKFNDSTDHTGIDFFA